MHWPYSEPPKAKLSAALVKAHADFGALLKQSDNPFFRSKYAPLEAVRAVVNPVLAKYGLCQDQRVQFSRDDMTMRCVTRVRHESGEYEDFLTILPMATWMDAKGVRKELPVDTQQGFAAGTYARRCGLQSTFGLAPEDDDGESAVGRTGKAADTNDPEWGNALTSTIPLLDSHDIEALKAHYAKLKAFNGKVPGDQLMAVLKPLGDRITQLKAKMILKGDK